jgi:hypothetical protein
MTFEEWEQLNTTHFDPMSNARWTPVDAALHSWNAATAEAEKRAKERIDPMQTGQAEGKEK